MEMNKRKKMKSSRFEGMRKLTRDRHSNNWFWSLKHRVWKLRSNYLGQAKKEETNFPCGIRSLHQK